MPRFENGEIFIKQLVTEYCAEPSISNSIRLQTYFNKAHNMFYQGLDFVKASNDVQAYVELMNFSQLVIQLSTHESYRDKKFEKEKDLNKKRLKNAISKLEELKPKIIAEYNEEIRKENEQMSQKTNENNVNNDYDTDKNNRHDDNKNSQNNIIPVENSDSIKQKIDKSKLPDSERWGNLLLPPSKPLSQPLSNLPQSQTPNNDSLDSIFNAPEKLPIIIPQNLVPGFVDFAKGNLKDNVETCGILCGKYNHDQRCYVLTHVILPKQKGTASTVQTFNEEELVDIQEKHSILTLGWVHTHPSQSCFLSSVDMHCQLSYQIMMPNAIAIVHSPSDKTQVFTLTKKGMEILLKCNNQGFHRHDTDSEIYEIAKHCQFSNDEIVVFIDLR